MASGDTNIWLDVDTNWANAANWSLTTIPVDGEHVVIPGNSVQPITTNVNRTVDTGGNGLNLGSFLVKKGRTATIGSLGNALRITAGEVLHVSDCQLHLQSDNGAGANTTGRVTIDTAMSGTALYLTGDTNISLVECVRGRVNIAATGANLGLFVSTLANVTMTSGTIVGSGTIGGQTFRPTVMGGTLEVITGAFSTNPNETGTLTVHGGTVTSNVRITWLTQYGGSVYYNYSSTAPVVSTDLAATIYAGTFSTADNPGQVPIQSVSYYPQFANLLISPQTLGTFTRLGEQ